MAIDIGDAVLTYLGDTTQLDATMQKVGVEAPAKLAGAQAAFQGTSDAVSGMAKEMAVGQQGAVELGTVMNLAGEVSRESMYQARGEAGLLGEAFGVHLPRHVRSFIAELPGVGAVLSAAFQATAVLFIIGAVVELIKKLQEFADEGHRIAVAQEEFQTGILKTFNTLDEKLLQSGIRLDELRGDHLAALRKEIELINLQTLDHLMSQFDGLAKLADALFKQMEGTWYLLDFGSTGAKNALHDFKAQYDLLLMQGKDKEANDLLKGTLKSAEDTLVTLKNSKKEADEIKALAAETGRAAAFLGPIEATEKEVKSVEALRDVLKSTLELRERNNKEAANEKTLKTSEEYKHIQEESDKLFKIQADADAKELKRDEDAREKARNEAIANLVSEEKQKIAITKEGSEARIKAIDAAIKEEESKGLQDEAFYRSLLEQRVRAVQAAVDQEQKAKLKALSETLKTEEESTKLDIARIHERYDPEAKAIEELAKRHIFTEGAKAKQLEVLYSKEQADLLRSLEGMLKKEKDIIARSQQELSSAKNNPLVTPEQISQLQTLLDRAVGMEKATQAKILDVRKDFQEKELAADRTFYGTALNLAIAAGNKALAAKLRENHAQLIAAQDKRKEMELRHQNTAAIEKEIKALDKFEKTLETNAKKGLSAWHKFSQGFMAEQTKDVKSLQDFGQQLHKYSEQMVLDLGDGFAAAINGQESFAQAFEQSVGKMLGKVATYWAEYYAALAIADVWANPAKAAAELAAAVALETLAGLLGSLGGGGSRSSSSGGSDSSTQPDQSQAVNRPANQPVSVINVARLASGGIVDNGPMLAVIGDNRSGGRGREAVIPLDDPEAMKMIRATFGGGNTIVVQGLISPDNMRRVVKQLNCGTNQGKWRVLASDSLKYTRRH